MRLILSELRSRLQYKIIVPFLLLTLCVALVGSAVAFRLVAGSWQERFSNQLAQVARDTNDSLVDQERANLLFLQDVVTAQINPSANAPAVADAIASGDDAALSRALAPYFRRGVELPSVHLDRLIAFDRTGKTRFDWERPVGSSSEDHLVRQPLNLASTWLVPRVLGADQDVRGDKFAGLIAMPDTQTHYLGTIAPVRQGTQIVGGLIVAMRVDSLAEALRQRSQAAIVAVYQGDGAVLASTLAPVEGINALNMSRQSLEELQRSGESGSAVFDVNTREYQFVYSPLRVRDDTIGIMAVALSRDYVLNAWADARQPLAVLTISLMLGIAALGVYIARLITAPLQELVSTARAVTAGDLQRRSSVRSSDEVGLLAQSFNTMTEHLLQLYEAVRDESSERAAIVESIVDGVVVCDTDGRIRYANRAMRQFLVLSDEQPLPGFFHQLPLEPLPESDTFGDQRAGNLFVLNQWIVRVSAAPVISHDGDRLGSVGVLQDMTAEVAVDRAKTNFIATISHELRTPLTVLRGNADLMLRGLMGQLEPEQRALIETMRSHTINMTSLVNNVIVIAGIDSGELVTDPEELELRKVLEEVIWPLRSQISAKGLDLQLDLPQDLPLVRADMFQLRTVLTQLIDNARRYTSAGGILVRALTVETMVRVDVSDTGVGIPDTLHERLFRRFVRGEGANEGINSSERGIGLGLAIVKQLVERQGGQVWLAHTGESGTTLSFTLPYANATQRHINPSSDEPHAAAA
ncbi:MAG: HAMP domain-containing protein [Chloroflexales bacterium]|nr:HAMP domain-containing protein [Chloroflexales bacterium]